ncbi:CDP-diacylglycerol--glycerol-3-phosphate 3-phosphatidyltransferase, mitochondrial [Diaphorina citri]|uniref:CDP-diacylglycerol--glycerol-3-phosphate 3-phosphatidyltransferase n=1 Tax=Diaphorina citri TaxID=121845 RepID=A0A1S3D4Z4_DIACI|nr:CDP-diacylglycerol--glycerol-3-phosphate 3-phosphatidyltransferase, mitochondrial [Diaphorina citri]
MPCTRGDVNSKTLLSPIVKQFSHNCHVSFYHTPDLRWPLNRLLPHRYNELIGLQHMKFYLIDNCVIITGANLSGDYFTSRQDRYMIIQDHKPLSDFFDDLSRVLCKISFQLTPDGKFILDKEFPLSPVSVTQRGEYLKRSRSLVLDMYDGYRTRNTTAVSPALSSTQPPDTWLAPLIELPPLHIQLDSRVTKLILSLARDGSCVSLGTGYFNLTQEYVRAMLDKPRVNYSVLMAHPTANGFLGARGAAGGIPYAYTALAARFLSRVSNLKVAMFEYVRSGWTYHAKGLWYSESPGSKPVLTLIGSPNFGKWSRILFCIYYLR